MKVTVGEAWLSEVAKSKETRDSYDRGINGFLGYCGCLLLSTLKPSTCSMNSRIEFLNVRRVEELH